MTQDLTVKTGSVRVGDIDVAYDVRGAGVPLLLVSGYTMTRAMWDPDFCARLAERGFEVVRFDNRDTGESTRAQKLGVPHIPKAFLRSMLGLRVTPAYTLEEMANDAFGLMTHLGHSRFHVVGASMGGMIAQTMAIEHPERIASLTSIMSTPGGRRYSFASVRALGALLGRVPKDRAAQVEHFVRVLTFIGGDSSPADEARTRRLAESLVASKPSASGSARQFVAILDSSGRRRQHLSKVRTPTLVVHGTHDPLLPVRGARAMTRMMPNAELLVLDGMGHSIASFRYDSMADAILRSSKRAS